MTDHRNDAGPGGFGSAEAVSDNSARNASSGSIVRHRGAIHLTVEERFATYPDARCNLRPTMFGLTLKEYRAEARKRQAESWLPWEINARFPRPESVDA